jgi:glycosyltransferase involved in cell wall biosynthesis
MPQLSVVIIAGNEECNIKRCLDSVSWADEVILVDDASRDKTIEIASGYPRVKVFRRTMDGGFGPQKQYALKQAKGAWVLSLDADECLTQEGKREIAGAIAGGNFDGYRFRRQNLVLGRFIADNNPGNLRLFRRDKGCFTRTRIHEEVLVEGKVGTMREPIVHYSSNTGNIESFLATANRYSALSARDLYERHKHITALSAPLYIFAYPAYLFCRLYFFQGRFRDGKAGFALVFFRCLEGVLSYVKLWELQRKNAHV